MDFYLLLKALIKILAKISLNTWAVNTDRKFPDHAKQSTTDAFKTAKKKQFKKQQKQLVIWLVIKFLNRITKFWRISQQNNLEITKNENEKEISKEKHISPEER